MTDVGEDWRITVSLDRSADVDHLERKLDAALEHDVTADEGDVHVWCATANDARRAVDQVEELVSGEIGATVSVHRWNESTEE
jgi:hypothetical protein